MKKGFKKSLFFFVLLGLLSITFISLGALTVTAQTDTENNQDTTAKEDTSDEDSNSDNEAPSFANPAQAQHAENLAAAVAGQADPIAQAKMDALNEAEAALADAKASGDEDAIEEAQTAYNTAKATVEETAAQTAGVTVADIEAMRKAGMGWGQIAHNLGVHPGVLGLGHKKGQAAEIQNSVTQAGPNTLIQDEITQATARDYATGGSKGHGAMSGSRSGSKSLGLEYASKNSGVFGFLSKENRKDSVPRTKGSFGKGKSSKDDGKVAGNRGGGKGGNDDVANSSAGSNDVGNSSGRNDSKSSGRNGDKGDRGNSSGRGGGNSDGKGGGNSGKGGDRGGDKGDRGNSGGKGGGRGKR